MTPKNISAAKNWLIKDKKPFIISGPCSAETEEQVIATAEQLKAFNKADVFRSGIWKPRTMPNSFEGVGKIGLSWLQLVKREFNLPVAVEVANARHVELCLEHNIDILWIGARTTVNPFAVQEIADALKGVDMPILIKNPINPDLGLWLGSVERIHKAGIKKIGAIHRGFSNLGESYYRNRPQWQLPLEFKRRMKEIPLICDPSHICGRRDILKEVSQKAMDLDYDGLMIESHIDPDNAWSDAKQQITPNILNRLINDLVIRQGLENVAPIQNQLDFMRQDINYIDDELINLLANRMDIARKIATYKKKNNMTILQEKRWNEILDRCKIQGAKAELSQEFIHNLVNAIHLESINHHVKVFEEE